MFLWFRSIAVQDDTCSSVLQQHVLHFYASYAYADVMEYVGVELYVYCHLCHGENRIFFKSQNEQAVVSCELMCKMHILST